MNENPNQNFLEDIIDRDKWRDFLKRFIEVLWINIFIVDNRGQLIIFPYENEENARRYGNKFLTTAFDINFSDNKSNFIEKFTSHGEYLELKNPFDFHLFAVPIKVKTDDEEKNMAYMVVGPVILNKKLENDDYRKLGKQLNFSSIIIDELIDSIHEIRVVSFVTIKAILDLLSEVAKDIVELTLEKKKLYQTRFNKAVIPKNIADAVRDLYTAIHLDELLITILDVALNLTQAECGSIMLLDFEKQELTVKVSRGLKQRVHTMRHKLGEGISGIVAQKNEALIIRGTSGDTSIKPLLKRPEIKKSAIIPLSSTEKGVFGILNIHTKQKNDKIEDNLDNLQYISRLVSAAIYSI